jgi:hypothetical protein
MARRAQVLQVLVAVAGLSLSAASAGTSFRQVIMTSGAPQSAGSIEMLVSAQGDALRSEFVTAPAGNPMFDPGSYFLMKGAEVFLVNPAKRTYARFDLAGLGDMLGSAQQGMEAMRQGGFEMSVENPTFEKLLEEDGGMVGGYPTTHYRYHSTYTVTMRMPVGGSFATATDTVQDIWTTTAAQLDFSPQALQSLSFGGTAFAEELGELAEAERAQMTGFPMKSVAVSTSTTEGSGMMGRMVSRGGNQGPVTTTMEVRDLVQGDLPASQFEIPAGYSEVQLLPTAGGAPPPNR